MNVFKIRVLIRLTRSGCLDVRKRQTMKTK